MPEDLREINRLLKEVEHQRKGVRFWRKVLLWMMVLMIPWAIYVWYYLFTLWFRE